jgi:hypothetical protein
LRRRPHALAPPELHVQLSARRPREYGGSLTVCCGHDPSEFERLSGRSPEIPAVPRLAWPEAARAMKA